VAGETGLPGDSGHYRVARSCLYGVQGFWVVTHPSSEGGICDEARNNFDFALY
jgi:hypothetical protein